MFEQLCRDFRQLPTPATRNRLIQFCQKTADGKLAGLGFFLVGIQDFENEKYDSAEKFFSLASQKPTFIEDYIFFYWSSALIELNQRERAQEKLEPLLSKYPASPFFLRGRKLYWDNALSLAKPQLVLDSISTIGDLTSNPEALYFQAQAFEMLGQHQASINDYQRLHFLFPTYPETAIIDQKVEALSQLDPSLSLEVPRDWRISRIEKLLAAKQYRTTLKDLEQLGTLDPPFALTAQFQFWKGISQFGSGRFFEAIQTLGGLNTPPPDMAAQAAFIVGECFRKLENYTQFKMNTEKMENLFPGSGWLEEAYFSIGNFNLVQRNLDESVFYYQKIIEKFPNGKHVTNAHWRVAWRQFRLRKYQQAQELFQEHLTRFRESDNRQAALYWSARCLEYLGKTDEAVPIYRESVQKSPHHFYGQMALKRLVVLNKEVTAEKPSQNSSESSNRNKSIAFEVLGQNPIEGWPRVKALAMTQLFEMAGKELANSSVYGSSPSIDFQVARLFYLGKEFYLSIQRLRRVVPNYTELAYGTLPEVVWQMLYPVNFQTEVLREARKQGVSPQLILGLIRQESTFNPRARSSANAHGLMQLLPSTARKIAREMRAPRPSVARLQDPSVNIRLGTRYLADLMKQFNGEVDKALASYNAGEKRVESWLSEGDYTDSAEFVETIPFSETRNYVKIIYRNYWFYEKLYGELNPQ